MVSLSTRIKIVRLHLDSRKNDGGGRPGGGHRRVPAAADRARRRQPRLVSADRRQRRRPGGNPAGLAGAGIPADYLAWYTGAAQTCPGLPWTVLAGIGKVESDQGQSDLPGVHSGANAAGAEGPMQFLPATFDEFAVDADPGLPVSPYDPADAIYTAARMLCADGARGGSTAGIEQAIFAYNHAGWYVREVLSWAASYATSAAGLPADPAGQPSPQSAHPRTPAQEATS